MVLNEMCALLSIVYGEQWRVLSLAIGGMRVQGPKWGFYVGRWGGINLAPVSSCHFIEECKLNNWRLGL